MYVRPTRVRPGRDMIVHATRCVVYVRPTRVRPGRGMVSQHARAPSTTHESRPRCDWARVPQRPAPAQMRLAGVGPFQSLPGGNPRCARACYATAAAGGAPGEPAGGNSMYNHPDCDWGGCYSSHDCPDASGLGSRSMAMATTTAAQLGAVGGCEGGGVCAASASGKWRCRRRGRRPVLEVDVLAQGARADRRRRSRRAPIICAPGAPSGGSRSHRRRRRRWRARERQRR